MEFKGVKYTLVAFVKITINRGCKIILFDFLSKEKIISFNKLIELLLCRH